MKVIHLSVECFPIAKVGGLADVVGALPKYQRQNGVDASVVMPWYDRSFIHQHSLSLVASGEFSQGTERLSYEVFREDMDVLGFPLYFIKIPGKLDRPEVYCYADEAEQWIAFQHAFLHYLAHQDTVPDIIHCHDHHVGLIPFLLQHAVDFRMLGHIKTVFTVHNGQYQGWMNWSKGILLPAFDTWKWGLLDWDGVINPLAAAIKCCQIYTTVSEGYLEELYREANGLHQLFYDERGKSIGIVNGIDETYWNPETDPLITKNYTIRSVLSGKRSNKKELCKSYEFDPSLPLLSFIGRFAVEKGADLLPEIIDQVFAENENKLSIFILGSGDDRICGQLEQRLGSYDGRLFVFFGYNEGLAHQVYAASDLLLMPSRVEPCGLNQLYAMKYGTIPVVRGIGGLRDTVIDIGREGGYGFVFDDVDVQQAADSIGRALRITEDKEQLNALRRSVMRLDFSWDRSAKKYVTLYNRLEE